MTRSILLFAVAFLVAVVMVPSANASLVGSIIGSDEHEPHGLSYYAKGKGGLPKSEGKGTSKGKGKGESKGKGKGGKVKGKGKGGKGKGGKEKGKGGKGKGDKGKGGKGKGGSLAPTP
jgi:hypothetical protein